MRDTPHPWLRRICEPIVIITVLNHDRVAGLAAADRQSRQTCLFLPRLLWCLACRAPEEACFLTPELLGGTSGGSILGLAESGGGGGGAAGSAGRPRPNEPRSMSRITERRTSSSAASVASASSNDDLSPESFLRSTFTTSLLLPPPPPPPPPPTLFPSLFAGEKDAGPGRSP